MSVEAINEAERTRDSQRLRTEPLSHALCRAEVIGGTAFFAAAGALAVFGGIGGFSVPTAALYVIAFAVAAKVRFDVGAGFTVPTQAVFVPMLFAVPAALAPLLAVAGLALGMAPEIARRQVAPSWLLTAPGNTWFALGPALVLSVANDPAPTAAIGVFFLALLAQFTFDFVAAAARDRLFEGDFSLPALAAEAAPIYAVDVALSLLGFVVALAAAHAYGQWPVVLIAPLFLILPVFSRERRERLQQLVELNDAYQGTALLLGDVVEADDSYTGEHSKSVVRLSLEVAEQMGLDADQLRNVQFGALLHDVGKISIPNEIINKPGELNEREWEIVKTHTIEGQKMLERIGGFMTEIGTIVRASHEAWDGSGYPDGLAGEEIPVEARVVSTCDAFNAMTTTRSYRVAMPLEAAIAELKRFSDSHFDPLVVRALLKVVQSPAKASSAARGVGDDDVAYPSPTRAGAAGAAVLAGPSASQPGPVDALADLAVSVGANVQSGQYVEVSGEIGHLQTLRAVAAAAYRRGAAHVDVQVRDPILQRTRIDAGAGAVLSHVPGWEAYRVRELVDRGGASILVAGPTLPGLFDGLDPSQVAAASAGPSAEWRDAARMINWTIVPGATEGWASWLRPQLAKDEALRALWADLTHVCRLDLDDPAGAWRERLAVLRARAEWLSALELHAVRFRGGETDLVVGLAPGALWDRAEMMTPGGVSYVPNLPTEEVYTTPDWARVDGRVRLTRPVDVGGVQVDDVVLRFRGGSVIEVAGPPEASALREFTARDSGAGRLGELALVDEDTRIGRLDQTFGETLLDENAACHIALGHGFPALMPAAQRHMVNASDHHLDVMIGAPEVEVDGLDAAGVAYPLLRDGHWVPELSRPIRSEPFAKSGKVA
ncbi:MAG: aminopeptidase [Solirubrobacterales bacterium]|nr:aminopeptidase [Solirubrobacterales bacterium]